MPVLKCHCTYQEAAGMEEDKKCSKFELCMIEIICTYTMMAYFKGFNM